VKTIVVHLLGSRMPCEKPSLGGAANFCWRLGRVDLAELVLLLPGASLPPVGSYRAAPDLRQPHFIFHLASLASVAMFKGTVIPTERLYHFFLFVGSDASADCRGLCVYVSYLFELDLMLKVRTFCVSSAFLASSISFETPHWAEWEGNDRLPSPYRLPPIVQSHKFR
jgi:hypothetical protein